MGLLWVWSDCEQTCIFAFSLGEAEVQLSWKPVPNSFCLVFQLYLSFLSLHSTARVTLGLGGSDNIKVWELEGKSLLLL